MAAHGKGGARNAKRKGKSRKNKTHNSSPNHNNDGSGSPVHSTPQTPTPVTPQQPQAVSPMAQAAPASVSRSTGGSMASGGSSGKQNQMFTIGTFEEDEEDSDNLLTRVQKGVHHAAHMDAGCSGTRSDGAADTAAGETEMETEDAVANIEEDPVSHSDANNLSHSRQLLSAAPAEPPAGRQPLFTMGSHSELSDIDSVGDSSQAVPVMQMPEVEIADHISNSNSSSSNNNNNEDGDDDGIYESSVDGSDNGQGTASSDDQRGHSAESYDTSAASVATSRLAADSQLIEAMADSGELQGDTVVPTQQAAGKEIEVLSASPEDSESQGMKRTKGLHLCKATTSLSQLCQLSGSNSYADLQSDGSGPALVIRDRITSAPATRVSYDTNQADATSPGAVSQKSKTARPPMVHRDSKSRKKVASKKTHLKKVTSAAAMRSRQRHSTGPRRETSHPRGLGMSRLAVEEGPADSSYVDYSGSSDPEVDEVEIIDDERPNMRTVSSEPADVVPRAHFGALEQSQGSVNSSTATLGGACQDADDTATTASTGSQREDQAVPGVHLQGMQTSVQFQEDVLPADHSSEIARAQPGPAADPHTMHPRSRYRDPDAADLRYDERHKTVNVSPPTPPHVDGPLHLADRERATRRRATAEQQGREPTPTSRRHSDTRPRERLDSSEYSSFHAMNTGRNMESQRQLSMVEREEEAQEMASSELTGMPRRSNRPAGSAPHIFLNPNSPAYSQQIRRTDRIYSYMREINNPLLDSISRCVELRERRAAISLAKSQMRSLSRSEPSDSDQQAAWWDSLLPPPPPLSGARRDSRTPLPHGEVPAWMLAPNEAKCAVYTQSIDTGMSAPPGPHDQADPGCAHLRELRSRAKELRFSRQQELAAVKNQTAAPPPKLITTTTASLETWRGRRVPGLLSVDTYAGSTVPVEGTKPVLRAVDPSNASPSDYSTRGNVVAAPYRRFGTVYGYTPEDHMYKTRRPHGSAHHNGAGNAAMYGGGYAGNFGISNLAHVHTGALSVRGDANHNRPSTAGLWDSDVRRSSYFDRLSIDESRPQMPASLQTSTAGLLRRVISGLTGSSSYGAN